MADSIKLSYFNGKGLGELSRLLLVASGTAFEDYRYPIEFPSAGQPNYIREEFNADLAKGVFPMGQVPILTVTKDGKQNVIVQSKAIERYVASTHGLAGANAEERAHIDSLCELITDIKSKNPTDRTDAVKVAAFFAEVLPKYLQYAENYITANATGFAVGATLSQADIVIYHFVTFYFKGEELEQARAIFARFPHFNGIAAKVLANPGVAAYEAARDARIASKQEGF